MSYSTQQAEVIALQALGWLSAREDLMMTFLGATGADLDDLRTRAADPDFLASVMDFILMDDDWVRGFCDENTIAYSDIQPIRMALPGGALPNWT